MISKNSLFLAFFVIFLCSCFLSNAETREIDISGISDQENLELERQLKMLNKHPVTTFQTKAGATIDCIKINKQPSLNHPLLKNHKIQMEPKSIPKGAYKSANRKQHGSKRALCPIGTVPIRRTTKQDLIIAKSFHKEMSNGPNNSIFYPDQKVVQVMMKFIPERYFGVQAYISIYDSLNLPRDQASSSNLWIQSGGPNDLNMISAGIMNSQVLNGDDEPRLFGQWTNNAFRTGCYNLLCQGFVQIDTTVHLGSRLTPEDIRFYSQNVSLIHMFQDGPNGNWWLMVGKSTKVGYWPSELFPYMRNGANHVGGGGATRKSGETWPPMGNTLKPDESIFFGEASIFYDFRWFDDKQGDRFPEDKYVDKIVESPKCYGLVTDMKHVYIIAYGGPGGDDC